MAKKLLREPLIHFLLIGALIYIAYGYFGEAEEEPEELKVTISSGEIESLKDQWQRVWRRPPTDEELEGLVRKQVRTRILHKEALAMGLDDGDQVIERRLAQKVELLAQSMLAPPEPTEEELQAWFEQNGSRFKQPDRYSMSHVYFNPDKRGDATLDDAAAALEELRQAGETPVNLDLYGDRFLLQSEYRDLTESELSRLFGVGFIERVVELEPGSWHGPVLSGYGTHLVILHNVIRVPAPTLDDVRLQVTEAWLSERGEELTEAFIESLMSRYEIVVEDAAAGNGGSGQ